MAEKELMTWRFRSALNVVLKNGGPQAYINGLNEKKATNVKAGERRIHGWNIQAEIDASRVAWN